MPKRVLILATDGFGETGLLGSRDALEQAGVQTILASPKSGVIKSWQEGNWGQSVAVDAALNEVSADEFDALLLPGGPLNPDALRLDDEVIGLITDFAEAQKPIAAICHAPWLLVEADIVDGRAVTGWPSIHTDLFNAGAQVRDEEVLVDGNLITSRNSSEFSALSQALIAALAP